MLNGGRNWKMCGHTMNFSSGMKKTSKIMGGFRKRRNSMGKTYDFDNDDSRSKLEQTGFSLARR